jgi:hypothetical protein
MGILCHSKERSDEEYLTTNLLVLQYVSGLRFFTPKGRSE